MATTPGSRRGERTPGLEGETPNPAPLNPMQEPLGSYETSTTRTSDANDVNIRNTGTGRSAGNFGMARSSDRRGRGFGATFAIVAAVLLAAFLVALYMGATGSNVATGPGSTEAPVAQSTPGNTGNTGNPSDTTGSTTPAAPSQEEAPAAGGNATGTGTTPPATTP